MIPRRDVDNPCMRKLNRLEWTDGISMESYGVRVGIRVNTPEALPYLRQHFPPEWREVEEEVVPILFSTKLMVGAAAEAMRPGIRQYHLVYEGSARLVRTLDLEEALDTFGVLLQLVIASEAPEWVFVRAGVVAWNGKAILLPSKSHSGNTTLVKELLRAGATYYSDHYALMDDQGRVHPYPHPLTFHHTEPDHPKRTVRHSAASLGAPVGQEPLPVGLIVDSQFRPGGQWRPRQLTPGQGALALLSNTVPARLRPEASLSVVRRIAEHAPMLRGTRGEAAETAGEILRRLG